MTDFPRWCGSMTTIEPMLQRTRKCYTNFEKITATHLSKINVTIFPFAKWTVIAVDLFVIKGSLVHCMHLQMACRATDRQDEGFSHGVGWVTLINDPACVITSYVPSPVIFLVWDDIHIDNSWLTEALSYIDVVYISIAVLYETSDAANFGN